MPLRPEIALASRLYFSQQGENRQSRPAVRVALAGMIVGVMVMILTICIVVGFKQTVTDKIAGFGAHIQVVSFDNNNTYDLHPIEVSDSLLTRLGSFEHVVKGFGVSWDGPKGHRLLGFLYAQYHRRNPAFLPSRSTHLPTYGAADATASR